MSLKVYLFDTVEIHENLLPLSFTRPVAQFRIGILTIKEKWERRLNRECRFLPMRYLQDRFGRLDSESEPSLFIAGNLLPDDVIKDEVTNLKDGEALIVEDKVIAYRGSVKDINEGIYVKKKATFKIRRIDFVFDIFLENPQEIREDFKLVAKGRESAPVPDYVRLIGDIKDEDGNLRLFIEEGAEIECDTINIKRGPVYIGKNTVLMEGGHLRGPLAICDNVKVRVGAKIYGGCTFGPYCKVGGEIDNTVMFGYSNKAHDGYLGNAVIGEWCNIGAGVNASNLKNDYSKIRVWNYHSKRFMHTDLQFCGLIMGDHSKIGVNCMLNTATVIGVGVNVHGAGFPRVFLPNFSEGSPVAGFKGVGRSKFQDIAERAMSRRDIHMDDSEKAIYDYLFDLEG